MSKLPVKSDPRSLEAAIADIKGGVRSVSIPLSDRQPEYTDYQALGFVLLETVLRQMSPWEIGFAAGMIGTSHPTARQRDRAKTVLKMYLGIDIDAGTVPSSAQAPVDASNDNEPVLPKRRKRAAA